MFVDRMRNEVIPASMRVPTWTVRLGSDRGLHRHRERLSSRLPISSAPSSCVVPAAGSCSGRCSCPQGGDHEPAVDRRRLRRGRGGLPVGMGQLLDRGRANVPMSPFLPMIVFAILFGLSMDYEVFLLSRVREEYVRTGDNHRRSSTGWPRRRGDHRGGGDHGHVFAAFLLRPTLKMFGLGLTVAVFVDATVVRMILVPATMELLGDANWWFHAGSTGRCPTSTSKVLRSWRSSRWPFPQTPASSTTTTASWSASEDPGIRSPPPQYGFWVAIPFGRQRNWPPRWTWWATTSPAWGVIASVWTARPTAPCSSAEPQRSGHPDPRRLPPVRPSTSPKPVTDRLAVQDDGSVVGLTNVYCVVSALHREHVAAVRERAVRWNGGGISSPSNGTVRIQAVFGATSAGAVAGWVADRHFVAREVGH